MAQLIAIDGDDDGSRFSFPLTGQARIGRALENDVVLTESSVSRLHARIVLSPTRCWIEDLGSRTGVVLNGEALSAPHSLNDGDLIRIGGSLFRFEAPLPEPAPTTATAATESSATLAITQPGVAETIERELVDGRSSIGRDAGCQIILPSPQIAPFHAILRIDRQNWTIAPLLAKRPILLNGAPITVAATLSGKDIVRIGPCALQLFRRERDAPAPAPRGQRVDLMPTMTMRSLAQSERGDGHALMGLVGGSRGMSYPLAGGQTFVGSGPECGVQIPGLPRIAISLTRDGDGFRLRAEGQGVPLRISGGRKPPCQIRRGELIEIGGCVLRLVASGDVFSAKYDESVFAAAAGGLPRWLRIALGLLSAVAVVAIVGFLLWRH